MIENREKEILSEIFSLSMEQTRALETRPSAEVVAQREERLYRIRSLLQQVSQDKHSKLMELSE